MTLKEVVYHFIIGHWACQLSRSHKVTEAQEDEVMEYGIVETECVRCGDQLRLERIDNDSYRVIPIDWERYHMSSEP